MSFTLFRILVLAWNNSPEWLRRLASLLGLPWLVNRVWVPYRHLPIPPTEQPVRRLIERLVQPGWICADVGGNYGMMTEVMAARCGDSGNVVAFEAHPLNAFILGRRMELNGLAKVVRVENKAVSDGSQKAIVLYAGRRRSPNEWNVMGHDVEGHQTRAVMEIPAVALDEYFDARPIQLVKIDVEGAEMMVIPGMKRLLRQQKPVCLVEFHSAEAWQSRQIFLDAGYTTYTLNGTEVDASSGFHHHVLLWPPGAAPQPALFRDPASGRG